jgi:hypothetical protein
MTVRIRRVKGAEVWVSGSRTSSSPWLAESSITRAVQALRSRPRPWRPNGSRSYTSSLTGLDVQENQARRLLDDLLGFREEIEREAGAPRPDPIVAYRWLAEAYEPAIAAIPDELRGKLEAAEVYHHLLEHRWFRSEELGR